MKSTTDRPSGPTRLLSRPLIRVVALAVFIVAALAIVNTSSWFQLRPATGTANALSHAAAPGDTAAER